ncbi:MAG: hypothetical protein DMG76_25455 [Acidobacteria bacterium]|nr:MAG: hypothetical protein DMG76_25455 [Acidobacteriota bacterium]
MKSTSVLLASAMAFVVAVALAPLLAQGAWKALFNRKDFTGWTIQSYGQGGAGRNNRASGEPPTAPAASMSTNPAERGWAVENGVITSAPVPNKGRGGWLATVDNFHDFELELDYKLDEAPNVECTAKLGPKPDGNGQIQQQANLSKDPACTFNSGIMFRTGYQLNLGRREAGEYVGVVVHRQLPEAIRGNVDWLSTGDCGSKNHTYLQDCSQFREIRHTNGWNHLRILFKGDHLQVWMNDSQIVDVIDMPLPGENWAAPAPISFQPVGEGGGFGGRVQFRNLGIREI